MRTAIFAKPAYIKFISNEYTNKIYWLFLCSTSFCVFLFDLYSPLGVAAGTPYALIVFGSLWFKGNQTTYLTIISGVSLTVIGIFLSPEQVAPLAVVLTNRILALIAISITAYMVLKIKSASLELNALMTEIYTDPLTQSKNNRAFQTELSTEINRSKRYKHELSLAFFSINFFDNADDLKESNTQNNNLIKKLFNEISKCIRNTDQLYRTGINEFAIVFTETDIHKARGVCNILQERITKIISQSCLQSEIAVHVGIAMLDAKDDMRKLCVRAEDALLNAKQNKKNRVSTLPKTRSNNTRTDIPAILSRPRSG